MITVSTFVVALALHEATFLSEDKTVLVFYEHIGGQGIVFGPKDKVVSSSNFGVGMVYDYSLTLGPGRGSKPLGRSRGLSFFTSETYGDDSSEEIFTLVFGKNSDLEGSTISLRGVWSDNIDTVELAIVAGTGRFRFVIGAATYQKVKPESNTDTYKVTCVIYALTEPKTLEL